MQILPVPVPVPVPMAIKTTNAELAIEAIREQMFEIHAATTCSLLICIHRMQIKTVTMTMLTVRNIPEEVHRALRVRAARRGRSMEAELRDILQSSVAPEGRVRLGSLLADIGTVDRCRVRCFRAGARQDGG